MASPFPAYSPQEFAGGAPSYIPVGKSFQGYTPDYEPLKDTMGAATFAKKYPFANQLMFGPQKKIIKKTTKSSLKDKKAKLAEIIGAAASQYTDEDLIDEALIFYENRLSKK